jgi:hypothetical protein
MGYVRCRQERVRNPLLRHECQLKRDCEGQPPLTWGLGLCPNFLLKAGRRPTKINMNQISSVGKSKLDWCKPLLYADMKYHTQEALHPFREYLSRRGEGGCVEVVWAFMVARLPPKERSLCNHSIAGAYYCSLSS